MVGNLAGLFSPKGIEENTQQNTEEYKVNFKNGKGGIYRSVIRFVPWYANPDKSVMNKIVSWVVNPTTGRGMYVDDPRTVGQYSVTTDMFFKFRNTGKNDFVDFAKKHFTSKQQYAALVQIIQDEQRPELQGQIKVWRFGKTIYDKLYSEEHPAMGEGVIPYNPIYGRYFSIVCTSQSGFNNFDQSGFFDLKDDMQRVKPSGMLYKNPATGNFEVVTESTDQQAVYDFLVNNSPDLGKYDYHPWTAEQQEHVDAVMQIAANYLQTGTIQQQSMQTIATNNQPVFPGSVQAVQMNSGNPQTPGFNSQPQSMPNIPPVPPVVGAPQMGVGLNMGNTLGGTPIQPQPTGSPQINGIEIPKVEPSVVQAPTNPAGGIGNIDDILANL